MKDVTQTIWQRWGCRCPNCRAGLRNDINHCPNCDHALVLLHERTRWLPDDPDQFQVQVPIPETQKRCFHCQNCTKDWYSLTCHECGATAPIALFTGFSDTPPPKEKKDDTKAGCVGCLFLAVVAFLFLHYCHHREPTRPTALPTPSLVERQIQTALAHGRFLAADDLPSLANKSILPNTFFVGTWTSDGGQSGGHPSVTAPLSGPPHVIHAWITFSHGIDVRTVRRGQIWTYTKDAPLRITEVVREGDGRLDVRANDSILP